MAAIPTSPLPGHPRFAIYDDSENQEPPSPSEEYGGDTSYDDAIPSIEHDEHFENEPAPYNSSYTSRPSSMSQARSRHASGVTTTSFISSLPSEVSFTSKPSHGSETRFSPMKERPPFRNPSSVRALQMSSPPPFAAYESPRERLKGSYKLSTPSRSGRSETPVSASRRSESHRSSQRRESEVHVQPSPRPTPTPQNLPLVLLHVTILPMQVPYSHDLMVKAMPQWLVENYKLLAEKLQDVVLMRRGLLIPHPNDEYDLLEERILESLELKTPRLLKCGHFVGSTDDMEESEDSEEEGESVPDDGDGRGSRMSGGTITVDEECGDEGVCTDCHREVRRPGKGTGRGTKRWDIKIYAANGLMRAGAWSCCWREMERCDVEISPWIPGEVRKDLEKKIEEEQEAARQKKLYEAEVQRLVQLQIDEEEKKKKEEDELQKMIEEDDKRIIEEDNLQKRIEAEEAERTRRAEDDEAARVRFDETLNEKIEEAREAIRLEFEAQSLAEASSVTERLRLLEEQLKSAMVKADVEAPPTSGPLAIEHHTSHYVEERPRSASPSRRPQAAEVPLSTLLWNYFVLLARDRKNIAIVILGGLLAFLAMNKTPGQFLANPSLSLSQVVPHDHLQPSVSSIFVTNTETTTATSIVTDTATSIITDTATMTATSVVIATVTHVEHRTVEIRPYVAPLSVDRLPAIESFGSPRVEEVIAPTVSVPEVHELSSSTVTSATSTHVEHSSIEVQQTASPMSEVEIAPTETESTAGEEVAPIAPMPVDELPTTSIETSTSTQVEHVSIEASPWAAPVFEDEVAPADIPSSVAEDIAPTMPLSGDTEPSSTPAAEVIDDEVAPAENTSSNEEETAQIVLLPEDEGLSSSGTESPSSIEEAIASAELMPEIHGLWSTSATTSSSRIHPFECTASFIPTAEEYPPLSSWNTGTEILPEAAASSSSPEQPQSMNPAFDIESLFQHPTTVAYTDAES